MRRSVVVLWLVAMGSLAIVAPCRAISFEEERVLGRQFDLAARARLPVVTDPEVVGYVRAIGKRITSTLKESIFEYRFVVVRDPNVNAFAVPGGYVYVNTGLIARVASDDEIAGVLSHEIAHVHNHHLARQQEATALMNYAALLGTLAGIVQPAIGALASAASTATQLKYRREFEQEADYAGARYLRAAGFDPHGMLDFFQKLADEQRVTPTFLPPYLLSHPLSDDRLNHLEAVFRTQQWSKQNRTARSFALEDAQVRARVRTEPPSDLIHAYHRALEADPANVTARYLYGVACLELGQLDTARTALEGAREAGLRVAQRELGRVALRAQRLDEARDLLARAAEMDPNDAGAQLDLGQTLEALGETDPATAAYRRAVTIEPDLEAAHHRLGILHGRAGASGEGFYHLALALRLRGDYTGALTQFQRAEAQLPDGDPRIGECRTASEELGEFLRVTVPTVQRPDSGGR